MAATQNLIGVGMPAAQAIRVGFTVSAKTGVGTAQTGATPITGNLTVTTTSSGQTAFLLPKAMNGSGPLIITNPNSDAALIFPQTGETIDGGSQNASVSIAQNKTRAFMKTGSTTWISLLTA